MLRGPRAAFAAALAIVAAAAVTAGCGGGGTSHALALDPVAAAATKTQDAGAARIRFALAVSGSQLQGKTLRLHGTGAVDGKNAEVSFDLGSIFRQLDGTGVASDLALPRGANTSLKEILLDQNDDYVMYIQLGLLAAKLPGGKQWVELDLSKLGKSAGLDLGKLLSGSELQPSDILGMLESEGAAISKVGAATVDGVATTHYRVTVDLAKALQSKGLTSPLLDGIAAQLPKVPEDVWIGQDGLLRRVAISYGVGENSKRVQVGMTMDLFDYGASLSIAAPPSDQVFDATQFAQQGIGQSLLH